MSGPFVVYMMVVSFASGVFATLVVGQIREAGRAYRAHCEDLERRREDFHRQQRFAEHARNAQAKARLHAEVFGTAEGAPQKYESP